jgi:multicomponent Na+:H+ antiporter subunit C
VIFLLSHVLTHWNYLAVIVLMMIGLYIMISRGNLVKKVMGMNVFQTSVVLLYVSMGKISGGTAPILIEGSPDTLYSNPLPHVLMLTAIVVGVASSAVGLALVVRVKEAYGTVEEDEIVALDRAVSSDSSFSVAPVDGVANRDDLRETP